MQYINDSAPARRLSVSVILDKRGRHVATVRVLFPVDGAGRVRAEIQHTTEGLELCAKAPHCWKMIEEHTRKHDKPGMTYRDHARELFGWQRGNASGYGYDKRAAALSGLIVAGHTLADHCGGVPEDEKKRARLMAEHQREPGKYDYAGWSQRAEKIGAHFANWKQSRANNLHFEAGLRRLERFGFTVVEAL